MQKEIAARFKVGNIIVGKPKVNNGTIKYIDQDGLIVYDAGDKFFLTFDDVEKMYIRKPRKGNKEARDIVAMLAWTYRYRVLNSYKKYGATKNKKLSYFYNLTGMRGYFAFNKAKSMLK